jgi:hypothetical protein
MSNELRKQIHSSLSQKETEELVEIWETNDRVEWTDEAFDVIREILAERNVKIPAQNEQVLEHVTDNSEDEGTDDIIPGEFTDPENAPVFYKPREVLWLETWLNRAVVASIGIMIAAGLLELPRAQMITLSYFRGNAEWSGVAWMIAFVLFALGTALQGGIYYFCFKALGSILKILMEMEFNSRGVKRV